MSPIIDGTNTESKMSGFQFRDLCGAKWVFFLFQTRPHACSLPGINLSVKCYLWLLCLSDHGEEQRCPFCEAWWLTQIPGPLYTYIGKFLHAGYGEAGTFYLKVEVELFTMYGSWRRGGLLLSKAAVLQQLFKGKVQLYCIEMVKC